MKKKNLLTRFFGWLIEPSRNSENFVSAAAEEPRNGFVDVVLGLQWGDEGKGKIVDVLTPNYDIIARFQGGPNAGHSLEIDGQKGVVNQIPSGAFVPGAVLFIGNGCVVDPHAVLKDLETIFSMGGDVTGRLFFSGRAKLILPIHIIIDKFSEKQKGKDAIGSTQRGITPAYVDHYNRMGLHVGDIYKNNDIVGRIKKITNYHKELIRLQGGEEFLENFDLDALNGSWMAAFTSVITKNMIVSNDFILSRLRQGKKVLAEGAQGTSLDIEVGDYPYVTSSHTTTSGACIGLAIPPTYIRNVYGIIKAYATRVGEGPFPGEIDDVAKAEYLRQKGHEYGATTGRPRRVGYTHLDLVRHAIWSNGVTHLFINKLDVLADENFSLLEGDSDHPFKEIEFDKNGRPNIHGETFISFMKDWLDFNCSGTKLVGVGTSPSRDGIFYC